MVSFLLCWFWTGGAKIKMHPSTKLKIDVSFSFQKCRLFFYFFFPGFEFLRIYNAKLGGKFGMTHGDSSFDDIRD